MQEEETSGAAAANAGTDHYSTASAATSGADTAATHADTSCHDDGTGETAADNDNEALGGKAETEASQEAADRDDDGKDHAACEARF